MVPLQSGTQYSHPRPHAYEQQQPSQWASSQWCAVPRQQYQQYPTASALSYMGCTTQHMSHMVTSQEIQQHQSSPVHARYVTSPALAAFPRGSTPPVHVPEVQPRHVVHPQPGQTINAGQQGYQQQTGPQQAPVPSLMYPADSYVPWSSQVTKSASVPSLMYPADSHAPWSSKVTSSLSVPCAQHHVDAPALYTHCAPSTLTTLCTPYTKPSAVLPTYPTYPCIPCNPYPTPTSLYDQQNATQHMIQAVNSDENKVFVSDGCSWKEFNLEKIFSC